MAVIKATKKGGRMSDTEQGHEPVSGHECKVKEAVGIGLEDMIHLIYSTFPA